MQNRSLIYIVCVVAVASLALLLIGEQGLVVQTAQTESTDLDQELMQGFVATDDSVDHEFARIRSDLPKQRRDDVQSSDGPSSPETVIHHDGWSRVEDLAVSQSADGSSDQLSASRQNHFVKLRDSGSEQSSSGEVGNPSRAVGNRVGALPMSPPVDAGVIGAEPGNKRKGSVFVERVSMIDRPEIRNASIRNSSVQDSPTILQVQNQEPATTDASAEEEGEAQQMGVPPPKETPAFLKKRSILLEPGQYQFEYGVRYSVDNNSYALAGLLQQGTTTVQVVNANRKKQLVSTPLEFRVGLQENLQGFLTLPLGWSSQSLTAGSSQQASDAFGIGDLGIGLTRVLWAPEKSKRRLLGFLQASAPTGDGEISLSQQERDASLGAGYWTLTAGGNVTESIDPLVLFGSLGYTHTFGTRLSSGNYVDVGNTFFYQVGVGYGINPYVTLSGSFSGASSGQVRLDDVVAVGTRTEPFSLRLSASVNKPDEQGRSRLGTKYEPFLRFGLTGLANDVEFGVRWTY